MSNQVHKHLKIRSTPHECQGNASQPVVPERELSQTWRKSYQGSNPIEAIATDGQVCQSTQRTEVVNGLQNRNYSLVASIRHGG